MADHGNGDKPSGRPVGIPSTSGLAETSSDAGASDASTATGADSSGASVASAVHTTSSDDGDSQNPDRQRARAVILTSRSGDRYVLGDPIAKGGMGEILGATDEQIGRDVAIKRMRQQNPSDRAMGRFFREACVQGRLDHPAIVPVHELGCDEDGRPYFVMKKLAGTTLAARIEEGHSRQRMLRAFADVCLAVELAHTRGVVHRDLKPANIVLGDFGEVYVLDWGVAKLLADDVDDVSPGDDEAPVGIHTADGVALGTAGYMAPEQARGRRDIDGRADVYALGCMLFEILAGVPLHPRGPQGLASTVAGIDARPSVRAPNREVPPELDALCVLATALDRDKRIATARELGERVQRYLDGDRDLAMRRDLALRELETARTAFANRDNEESHRLAMRHAGRALALDPTLHGAAELVSRLMLEPPRTTPPEVLKAIDAGDETTLLAGSRAGLFAYLGFAGLFPLFATGGMRALPYLGILFVVLALNAVMLLKFDYKLLRSRSIRIAIGHALLISLLALMFAPFQIAPGVAAVITMALVFSPIYRAREVIMLIALMCAAILTPFVLEETGVIAQMTIIGPESILYFSAFELHPAIWLACLLLYVVALVGASGGIAYTMRRSERRVRQQLALQTWQLQQLVGSG